MPAVRAILFERIVTSRDGMATKGAVVRATIDCLCHRRVGKEGAMARSFSQPNACRSAMTTRKGQHLCEKHWL